MIPPSTGRTGTRQEPKWRTHKEFTLSKRRRYQYGCHGRLAHQDDTPPTNEKFKRRQHRPNAHPRRVQEFEARVRVARRWILETVNNCFNGAFYAVSEGHAIEVLNKKVRPRNTRLGRGKERLKVLLYGLRGLLLDGYMHYDEDRAIYGTVRALAA